MDLFNFRYVDDLTAIFTEGKSFNEVRDSKVLYEWDNILAKRVRMLEIAFIFTITNFERGIATKNPDFENEQKVINLILFEYYCESTFHHIQTLRDVILQIINSAFNLKIKENEVSLKRIKNSLEILKIDILNPLKEMEIQLQKASNIRNSFVHRFSSLDPDHRPSMSDDGLEYYAGTGTYTNHDDQVKIIENSVSALSSFWEILRLKFAECNLLST